jgi:hypothetical protein
MLLVVQAASFASHDPNCRVVKRRSDRFAFIIEQSTYATWMRTCLGSSALRDVVSCQIEIGRRG